MKFSTMFVVSRWLSGESLMDKAWQMASLYTLVGFTTYQLSTRNFVDTSLAGEYQPLADDWIKVSTMFIVSRLLSGGSLFDPTWLMASLATLIGFSVYDLITAKYVKGSELSSNPELGAAIDDTAKWGSMFLVSRLITCQSVLNAAWASSSVATIVGFIFYDLVTGRLMDYYPWAE